MLKIGDKAPDFTLMGDDGKETQLSSLRGQKVVLYFYPKDNTSGCTKEACSLRDRKKELEELNATIVGISRDSSKSHQNFREKQGLNFPLLSDTDKTVHQLYGAWGEKKMYGKTTVSALRKTFVIDEEGTIIKIYDKVAVATHGEDVEEFLRTL